VSDGSGNPFLTVAAKSLLLKKIETNVATRDAGNLKGLVLERDTPKNHSKFCPKVLLKLNL
jgi:hypothetical protein